MRPEQTILGLKLEGDDDDETWLSTKKMSSLSSWSRIHHQVCYYYPLESHHHFLSASFLFLSAWMDNTILPSSYSINFQSFFFCATQRSLVLLYWHSLIVYPTGHTPSQVTGNYWINTNHTVCSYNSKLPWMLEVLLKGLTLYKALILHRSQLYFSVGFCAAENWTMEVTVKLFSLYKGF